MMRNDNIIRREFSFLNKVVVRFFIVFLFLFILLILDKVKIINYDKFQDKVNENLNFMELFNKFIGNKNNEESLSVFNENYYKEVQIEDFYRRYLYDEDVLSNTKGVIIRIEKNDTYSVYVQTLNGNIYKYSNLYEVKNNIYSTVNVNEIIGKCNFYYDLKIYEE